jgi:outer membrane lipoprotein carrier protein
MRVIRAAAAALAGVLASMPAAAQNAHTAQELAFALQKRYDGIRDFSADFEHKYRGGVLRRETVERGTLLIKKPGRMRWEYTAPEQKLFISNGSRMYFYVPADKQVTVSPMPDPSTAPTPALFLAGRGNLTRDFDVSLTEHPDGVPQGTQALRLVPRTPQAEYDWLVMAVDAKSLTLRALVSVDAQGGTSTFLFTNLKENVTPPDSRFEFEVPRGVDVINAQQ